MPRILVADDNPLSLRFLSDVLAEAGAEVHEAVDGIAAVRLASASAFDLLLLDARMPGLDGAAALAHIRAGAGPSRDAVALATTADDAPATAAALREHGFAAVLPKPLAVDALRVAVASHLPPGARAMPPATSARATRVEDSADADALDDEQARRAAGGDAAIVAALRSLFAAELDALPAEIAAIAARADHDALRERLHRLDASAGFCGVPALVVASARLRDRLAACAGWPASAVAEFLAVGERARQRLSG